MKKYRVHFPQQNEMWIDVEASSGVVAANKALRERRQIFPLPDCVEHPNGTQESLDDL